MAWVSEVFYKKSKSTLFFYFFLFWGGGGGGGGGGEGMEGVVWQGGSVARVSEFFLQRIQI